MSKSVKTAAVSSVIVCASALGAATIGWSGFAFLGMASLVVFLIAAIIAVVQGTVKVVKNIKRRHATAVAYAKGPYR